MLVDQHKEMRIEQDKMKDGLEKVYNLVSNASTDKDEVIELLSNFIKCTGDDVMVCRTTDNKRIVVANDGLMSFAFRGKRPEKVTKISEIMVLLKEHWIDFNAIRDDEVIKRIECFLKAVKKLPDLSIAFEKFQKLKGNIQINKEIKFYDSDGYGDDEDFDMKKKKVENIVFHENYLEFISTSDNFDLYPDNLNHWFAIEQVKDVVFKRFESLEKNLDESVAEVNKHIELVKDDLAPILMLESA